MKRFFALMVLSMLFATFATASNSLILNDGGGGRRQLSGAAPVGGGSSGTIAPQIIDHILHLAAPQFGVSYGWLVHQYDRGAVTILEIGQNLYSVTYGGITIQILIESGVANGGGDFPGRRAAFH
jgi:hypothetical protein